MSTQMRYKYMTVLLSNKDTAMIRVNNRAKYPICIFIVNLNI